MAYCANCGNKIEDDSLFCSYCGAPVEPDEIETEPETKKLASNSLLRAANKTVQSEPATEFEETTPEETTCEEAVSEVTTTEKSAFEEAGTEETSLKEKKTLKGLIVAVVILGVLVLLAISAAIVITVKGYNISDIVSIKSESSRRVESIVEEEKWKPSSMEIMIDYNDEGPSINELLVYSYEGDKLKKVSLKNDVVNIEYDDEGNCTNYYNWVDKGNSIVLINYKYFYDDNNYIIKDERSDYSYSIYQNDVNGNHIHVDYYTAFLGEPTLYMTDDSTYDELNRVITTHRYYIIENRIEDYTYHYTGTNTEPDNIASETKYLDNSREYISSRSFSYEYDISDRITKMVGYWYIDNELVETVTICYYYN